MKPAKVRQEMRESWEDGKTTGIIFGLEMAALIVDNWPRCDKCGYKSGLSVAQEIRALAKRKAK